MQPQHVARGVIQRIVRGVLGDLHHLDHCQHRQQRHQCIGGQRDHRQYQQDGRKAAVLQQAGRDEGLQYQRNTVYPEIEVAVKTGGAVADKLLQHAFIGNPLCTGLHGK